MGRKRLKSLRSDILLDRKVVASGTQILPHRHHPHSPLIYVLHHCSDFLNLLTQADHQSGLADYPSLACRPPEHTQGPLVIRLRPYCSIQTRNCLHIVIEYVRFSLQNYINCRALPSKVRHQHLNTASGSVLLTARMVAAKWAAPPSDKSSRVTEVMTT